MIRMPVMLISFQLFIIILYKSSVKHHDKFHEHWSELIENDYPKYLYQRRAPKEKVNLFTLLGGIHMVTWNY